MSVTGVTIIVIMIVAMAWLMRVLAGGVYPNGYFTAEKSIPPFWLFIGCSSIFSGVMFQLTWINGISPLFFSLVPLGLSIVLVYRFAFARRRA